MKGEENHIAINDIKASATLYTQSKLRSVPSPGSRPASELLYSHASIVGPLLTLAGGQAGEVK
jgi:hypothetical protein